MKQGEETKENEEWKETTFNANNLFHATTFALKQITIPLFDVVAVTHLLIRLSCYCCRFWFIRLFGSPFVRRSSVLLIRQTMPKALLNAFTWSWTRAPSTPTAPSCWQSDFESENEF